MAIRVNPEDGRQDGTSKRTPSKLTVKIDPEVLKPWRDVAWVLGVSLSDYLENYLESIADCVSVPEEIADITVPTRARAERIAERLEKLSVDEQLSGRSDIGTVACSVVETPDGRWMIKVDYLSPEKLGWRRISLLEEAEDN
jgi:hypothetical protein